MKKSGFFHTLKKHKNAYLFISPFFILYAIFGLFPMLFSLVMSFSKYTPTKGFIEFVGLQNYANIFSDPVFWKALYNTLWFVVFNIPILVFCSLGVAAVLNNKSLKGRKFFQIICLLPYVTSSVAYGIVFFVLFDTRIGLINVLLNQVGIPSVPWMTDGFWTKITVNIVLIWAWTGYNMLIMLGGLQNIDAELYEAARVDGATSFKCFWKITVPMMRPVVYFVMIASVIGTFGLFNEPYVLLTSTGGVENSSLTLNMYLYNQSFKNFQLSYGAATSFIIFILIMIFSIPQVRNTFKSNQ